MQPLDDLVVVDASQALVGPFATQTFGDMGAEIIKIERPGTGDLTRSFAPDYGDLSAYFVSLNRNKQSITLDLASEDGRDVLHDLVAEADVFIQNFGPGVAERLDADYDTLSDLNDDLVYTDVSGYGAESPHADRKSFDIVLQGESGIMSVTGSEDQPARVGISISDISAAMTATYATLTALYHRERTGEGQYVDIALLDTSFQWLLYHVTNFFATGETPRRMGTRHPNLTPYQALETSDDWIVIGVISEAHWPAFCEALDREDWLSLDRFETFTDRVENREEFDALLDDIFAERTTAEWVERLRRHDVPCTPLNSVADIAESEHVAAREMVAEMDHPDLGTFRAPGNPVNFSTLETDTSQAPPTLGQHTEAVLEALGYDDEAIADLSERNVI